jgi:DNA-binding CsgD family transcriptional regulator
MNTNKSNAFRLHKKGILNEEIARRLNISPITVRRHINDCKRQATISKLILSNRALLLKITLMQDEDEEKERMIQYWKTRALTAEKTCGKVKNGTPNLV